MAVCHGREVSSRGVTQLVTLHRQNPFSWISARRTMLPTLRADLPSSTKPGNNSTNTTLEFVSCMILDPVKLTPNIHRNKSPPSIFWWIEFNGKDSGSERIQAPSGSPCESRPSPLSGSSSPTWKKMIDEAVSFQNHGIRYFTVWPGADRQMGRHMHTSARAHTNETKVSSNSTCHTSLALYVVVLFLL